MDTRSHAIVLSLNVCTLQKMKILPDPAWPAYLSRHLPVSMLHSSAEWSVKWGRAQGLQCSLRPLTPWSPHSVHGCYLRRLCPGPLAESWSRSDPRSHHGGRRIPWAAGTEPGTLWWPWSWTQSTQGREEDRDIVLFSCCSGVELKRTSLCLHYSFIYSPYFHKNRVLCVFTTFILHDPMVKRLSLFVWCVLFCGSLVSVALFWVGKNDPVSNW